MHSPAEIDYEIYDKELLIIICGFKEWSPLLEASLFINKVIPAQRNLTYFTTKWLLNHSQT
jgi:hypothetical protein